MTTKPLTASVVLPDGADSTKWAARVAALQLAAQSMAGLGVDVIRATAAIAGAAHAVAAWVRNEMHAATAAQFLSSAESAVAAAARSMASALAGSAKSRRDRFGR